MITSIEFEVPVLVPYTGDFQQRYATVDGWRIERLGAMRYRLARDDFEGPPRSHTIEGFAAVYLEAEEPAKAAKEKAV